MTKPRLAAIAASLIALSSNLFADDLKIGEFVFDAKAPWISQQPSSAMRAAELKFDAEGDVDPVAIFFTFGPGQGGDAQSNIDRWKGMFQGGPSAEEKKELPKGAIMVVLTGTFLDGPPFGGQKTPLPDYRMLAAFLPSEQGAVYVRFTGPVAAVDSARAAFEDLIKSALD
jgi:hypothetical protein